MAEVQEGNNINIKERETFLQEIKERLPEVEERVSAICSGGFEPESCYCGRTGCPHPGNY